MDKLRNAIYKHPVLWAILILIIILAVQNLLVFIFINTPSLISNVISELGITIITVFIIYLINGKGEITTSFKGFGYALKLTWFPIAFNFALAITGIVNTITNGGTLVDNAFLVLIEFLFFTLCVGICEEGIYRGIFLSAFLAKNGGTFKGLLKACIYSSFFFGLVHVYGDIINAILNPSSINPSVLIGIIGKILQTGLFGFILCVVVLRTHNLWVAAIIHFINDLPVTSSIYLFNLGDVGNYANAGSDVGQSLMIYSMYVGVQIIPAIYAYFQLKKVNLPQWGMDRVSWFPLSVKKVK